jgi:drug/metabolite transporter (DMT)-like permease
VATRADLRALPGRLAARPRGLAVAGALTIAFSAILVRLSEVTPSTSAFFRCLYALPLLAAIAALEDRRLGPRSAHERHVAAVAGVLLGIDLLSWHRAIADIGAGLSTVLANLQVVAVPLLAWALLGERPGRRVLSALPIVLAGVVLLSGALEDGAYGRNPARGVLFGVLTGVAYAGVLLVLRHGSADRRRPAGPLFDATAAATVTTLAGGLAIGDLELAPSWPEHGWLLVLALTSQVLGWILISVSLPRLPAALASVLLTVQPLASVLLGAVLLSEAPSALQVAGVAALLAGLLVASRAYRPAPA